MHMNIEIKNNGLTNSGRFFNKDKGFDVERAFDYYCGNIQNSKQNLKFIIEDGTFTEEQILFQTKLVADEFYTLVVNGINWNKLK